ncbi:MAG: peptidoglycan D,D-transpeptidase FtsI family protein [Anaerolineae bacterium]
MNQNINRLATALLLSFLLVAFALAYWQLVRATDLWAREDNPRHLEMERRIQRGRILDRDGVELARTEMGPQGARRVTPYPPLAHVTGYWSLRYGTAGIENTFNDDLRGLTGQDVETVLRNRLLHHPQAGHDVVLTVDLDLQRVADEALGDRRGAVVLLDPRDGAILALASRPYFNPNTLDQDWEGLKADPSNPLINRATQGRYPPGSTWKTVTLAASLQEGLAFPGDIFDDGDAELVVEGFPIHCDNNPRGVNSFDLAHAYGYSCNLTFARLGLELGTKRYKEYGARFGLGQPLPLEIPTVASQLANDPFMDRVLLASTAFGQGELAVTPLQMALVAAAMANDGAIPRPHLLLQVRDKEGNVLKEAEEGIWQIAVTPRVARQVREMMVVSVEEGWARGARIPGVQVAGKTGTAEVGGGAKPHAWFIGFAPAQEPRYAIAVLVENGGEGSRVAVPIARQVLEAALKSGLGAGRLTVESGGILSSQSVSEKSGEGTLAKVSKELAGCKHLRSSGIALCQGHPEPSQLADMTTNGMD